MRKVFAWVLAAVMLLAMSTVTASASRQHHGRTVSYIGTGLQAGCSREYRCRTSGSQKHCSAGWYIDADCDGLCDQCGAAHCKGHESGCKTRHCWGNYADADCNGICDNCGYAHCGGEGAHACRNCGIAHCWGGYADANGDSLCDNCGYIHCEAGCVNAGHNGVNVGSGNGNCGGSGSSVSGGHHSGSHHSSGHHR